MKFTLKLREDSFCFKSHCTDYNRKTDDHRCERQPKITVLIQNHQYEEGDRAHQRHRDDIQQISVRAAEVYNQKDRYCDGGDEVDDGQYVFQDDYGLGEHRTQRVDDYGQHDGVRGDFLREVLAAADKESEQDIEVQKRAYRYPRVTGGVGYDEFRNQKGCRKAEPGIDINFIEEVPRKRREIAARRVSARGTFDVLLGISYVRQPGVA